MTKRNLYAIYYAQPARLVPPVVVQVRTAVCVV